MPDKITTLKLVDNTDVFPNTKDENIPNTIMRIADLSKYLNQLKSINITGDIDSTTITSDIATFTTADISTLNVSGISQFEGEATFGNDVHVDGNLVVNGIDNIVDKDGNKIVNTGTFDPTSNNPASQKAIATYYGQGGQGITSFENIVDKYGHKRFQEWDGAFIGSASMNPTINYEKCSLSGSHMMIVICFSLKYVEGGHNTIDGGSWLFAYTLPQWVVDKIIPLYSGEDQGTISYRNIEMIHNGEILSGDYKFRLVKLYNNKIVVANAPGKGVTYTADTTFRVQFDLVIDNSEGTGREGKV